MSSSHTFPKYRSRVSTNMWIISSVMSSLKFMSMHATKYRLAYLATAATSSEPKTATALRALSRGQPRQRRRQRRRRPARCKHAPLVHQLHPFPLQHIAHRSSPAENQVVHLAQHSRLRLGRKRLVPRTNQARGASDEHWASSAAPQASSKRAPLLVVRPLDQHTRPCRSPREPRASRRACRAGSRFSPFREPRFPLAIEQCHKVDRPILLLRLVAHGVSGRRSA